MIRDANDRREKVKALTKRYRNGEFSETVFRTSLLISGVNKDDMTYIIHMNQAAYMNSRNYRIGLFA